MIPVFPDNFYVSQWFLCVLTILTIPSIFAIPDNSHFSQWLCFVAVITFIDDDSHISRWFLHLSMMFLPIPNSAHNSRPFSHFPTIPNDSHYSWRLSWFSRLRSLFQVERPGQGDETRRWGPPFLGSESCYFLSVNRNKKSVAVDLKNPDGVDVLRDLASRSDVLVENFVPGALDRLGLGYDALERVAPRLIYCSISGYGSEGPYGKRPGYDVIAASFGGLLGVTGPEDGEPCKVGVAMTDLSTGLYAHGAIMAALLERQRTGKGQRIGCDLLSTQLSCMVNLASNYLNGGIEAKRWGTAHESIVPYEAFSDERRPLNRWGREQRAVCSSVWETGSPTPTWRLQVYHQCP